MRTPIIALTAMPARDKKIQSFLNNKIFDECIHKPFDALHMQKILDAVVGEKKIVSSFPKADIASSPNEKLVLNIEKVLPIFSNDIGAYKELFNDFFAALPERIKKLRENENAGDWKKLSVLAHNLTGVTRNFGVEKISALAEKLDEMATQENASLVHCLIDKIAEGVPELEEVYSTLITREIEQSIRE